MTRESEILESAITIVEGVLRMPVLERHKRGIISGMIWAITEARGKYRTRYRSKASLQKPTPKLHHEHVLTRKDLTDRIMAEPDKVREILSEAVACVVTVEEHRKLAQAERQNPALRGWDRYIVAGIEWVDTDNPS
ncbi:MAG: hypothetical protein ACXW5U_18935 [Thermoanaerobaculia bacterium]